MRAVIFAIYFSFSPLLSLAQENIIVDKTVNINFEPNKANLLFNNQTLKAEFTKLRENEYLVIAAVSSESVSKKQNLFSFILTNDNNDFYATPFSKLATFNKSNDYQNKLIQKNQILAARISEFKNERDKLLEESKTLEKELAARINLAEILRLKSKLTFLNNSINFNSENKNNLTTLLENKNKNIEAKDLATNSRILSQHLSDAAKVTAAAERLSRKKKETALTSFKQKLVAIEEMQQADLSAMAKQLLELRKIRNRLENTSDSANQF